MTDVAEAAARRIEAAGLQAAPDVRRVNAVWSMAPHPDPGASIGVFAPAESARLVEAAGARRLTSADESAACAWVGAIRAEETPAPGGFARLAAAGATLGVDAIYADDLILGPHGARLRLKPVFDDLLLASLDYIGGAILFRVDAAPTSLIDALASGVRPAEALRAAPELRVGHLPYPALIGTSGDAMSPASGGGGPAPTSLTISAVVPNRDSPALMRVVAEGALRASRPAPAKLIVTDNGSTNPETLALYRKLEAECSTRVDIRTERFNFAAMVNRGAALAAGDAILLLNNDVEVIDPYWLGWMAETLARPGVGVVGARLLFPDRTIQHAGVVVGHGGVAGHDMKGMAEDAADPLGRMAHPHQRAAVTAACMLIRRQAWEELGGFDDRAFPVAFNDVDFCLRARAAGWRVALDPRAVLIHHESVSRRGPFSLRRFVAHRAERAALRRRHGTRGMIDPFESPWRDHDDLAPNFRMLRIPPQPRV